MRMETIAERRERVMREHERRTAGERRRNYWQAKAEQAELGERRIATADRREAARAKAADSRAVAAWLERFNVARARLAS